VTTKSKLVLIVAVALSIASSALAQSLNPGDGTGNNLPYCYGPGETHLYGSQLLSQLHPSILELERGTYCRWVMGRPM
jgi:hypothetical protein